MSVARRLPSNAMRIVAWLPMVLAAVLAGCGGSPAKPSSGHARARAAAAPERARVMPTVYIYRQPGGIPGPYPKTIFIDGKPVGLLVANGYLKVSLAPGVHVISTPAANKAEVTLHMAWGASYYVSQEIIPAHPPYVLLNRVKEAIGKPYVAHAHRQFR